MAHPDDSVPADDADGPGDDDLRRLLADVAHAPSQAPPAVAGDRVGRYVLVRRLGVGGMGVVFAAYDPQLDRRVAIKLLRRDLVAAPGSVRARERTLREARALARLIHPGIVAVHDAGFHEGELYIVMELVEGQGLGEWLASRPRTPAEIVDVFRQAAIGLGAAHAQQMVHRDFKPDNVLIGKDGRVRVADFGLVHIADASSGAGTPTEATAPRAEPEPPPAGAPPAGPTADPTAATVTPALTVTGAFMGTPAFMAPEQLEGGAIDARTDQFAFGVSLWGALYGQPPWTARELGARRAAIAAGPPPEPPAAKAVPAWLRAIVRRAIATAPADRFPSMTALVAAIDRGRAGRRRLTAALAAAAIAALVAGAITVGAVRGRPPVPCSGGAALVGQAWSPRRASEVRAALLARGVASAPFEPLFAHLDDYGRAWAKEHRAACRATRVDGTRSEYHLDLRMACLDRARASMRALVGALADGRLDDPDLRARTGELPPLAACADDEALDGADRRPPAVDEVRLQEAMNLMFDARLAVYDIVRADATTRSERALAAARATAWAPLVSDAALVHGELLRLRERYDEARPFYDEALREALRGGPTSAQAEIMASLSYLEILRGRPDEAQAWIDRAMALLLRLHRPRELDLLVLDDAFAIALATGDLARARAYAEREVALASDPAHLDHRRLAEALLDVARLAVAEGRYADAVATVERAMAIGQEVLGPDAPWLAIPLELELEPLIALGRTREAKAAVERAIAVRAPVFGADDPLAGNLYAMLGAVAQRHGDLVAARAAFADALPRAIATHGKDSTTAAMAIANLAMVDAEAGDHARAEESALAAQRIFERQLGADAAELVNVLIIRAYAARGQGRLADARGHLERGHRIALATRGAGHPETANLEVELAHTDRLAGRRPAAIARYRAVLARAGELPPPMIAEAGFGLAQAAWAEGARADARIAGDDARNTYLLLGDDFAGKRAEVEAWLAAHPAPP